METVQLVLSFITPLLVVALGYVVTRSNRSFEEALTRRTERQELRFASYGQLWAKMRPLAIYDDHPVNRTTMADLSKELSDWYFSANGGIMLTTLGRELYFALQKLLRLVSTTEEDWSAEGGNGPEVRRLFKDLLEQKRLTNARAFVEQIEGTSPEDWPGRLEVLASRWSNDVPKLAEGWTELHVRQRFAVLQQVSSVLRTGLTGDVESRLR